MRWLLLLSCLWACDDQPQAAPVDVGLDAGYDAEPDARPDAKPDVVDAEPDVPDVALDGPVDVAPDGPPDLAVDGPPDMAPDLPACALNPEICNNEDDDCDGRIDEDLGLGDKCMIGEGGCAREGILSCGLEGKLRCFGDPGQPVNELCNRRDDDCDGAVDEDLEVINIIPAVLDVAAEHVGVGMSGPRVGVITADALGAVEFFAFSPAGGRPIRTRAPRAAASHPLLVPLSANPDAFATGWLQPDAPLVLGNVVNEFQRFVERPEVEASAVELVEAGDGLFGLIWTAPRADGPYFRFMDDRFEPLGPTWPLAEGPVARDASAAVGVDEIGVVWVADDPAHVYFRRVNDLGPVGDTVRVSAVAVEPETRPRIAAGGDRFVITWHDAQGVQVTSVSPDGPGDLVRLARGRWPNVAYDGEIFAAAWSDPQLKVARLTELLEPFGLPVEVGRTDAPAAIFGARGEFLLGWIRDDEVRVVRRTFCVQP